MYFTSLPDESIPGFNKQAHFSKFGKYNVIFNATSRFSNCDSHVGCLSFKTVLKGEEWYGFGHHRVAVRPGQFLVLNDEQEYWCRITNGEPTKTLSVFFKNEFALQVLHDSLRGENELLDDPAGTGGMPEFFQTLQVVNPVLRYRLGQLTTYLDKNGFNSQFVDESLVFLLSDLIAIQHAHTGEINKVAALKPATRMEIYRRLCAARDFLHSTYIDNPSLDDISRAACLSVPQLVRQFKMVFGVTTHKYLNRVRLNHATDLLRFTRMPIHEITWRCGFENASAFSRAFKSEFGEQPTDYRWRETS
jgi:AraC-like DNA-binding protein